MCPSGVGSEKFYSNASKRDDHLMDILLTIRVSVISLLVPTDSGVGDGPSGPQEGEGPATPSPGPASPKLQDSF